jgi:hypothetical protein
MSAYHRPQSGILILMASWPPTQKSGGQIKILVANVRKIDGQRYIIL